MLKWYKDESQAKPLGEIPVSWCLVLTQAPRQGHGILTLSSPGCELLLTCETAKAQDELYQRLLVCPALRLITLS